jgi:hypothetical protein
MKTGHQGNADGDGTKFDRRAIAISVWENEGERKRLTRMVNSVAASKWIAPGQSIMCSRASPHVVDGSAMTHLSGSAARRHAFSQSSQRQTPKAERANAMNSRPKE